MMDTGAEQQQSKSSSKMTPDETEVADSRTTEDHGSSLQAEERDVPKLQPRLESSETVGTESEPQHEPAEPFPKTTSKSSGIEPDTGAEHDDASQTIVAQHGTEWNPDPEQDQTPKPEEKESYQHKAQESYQRKEQELYQRKEQESYQSEAKDCKEQHLEQTSHQSPEQESGPHKEQESEPHDDQVSEPHLKQESESHQEQESELHHEQEADRQQEQKADQNHEQESNPHQKQESDRHQEQKPEQHQEQKSEEHQGKELNRYPDQEPVRRQEQIAEPRGDVFHDENAPLIPGRVRGNRKNWGAIQDEDKRKLKIFVIGKTGSGKSTLCNRIIGRDVFATGRSFSQVTTEMKEETAVVCGLDITVVDTHDISTESETDQEATVKTWKQNVHDYIYMVVLTVRCDTRYSPAEYEVFKQLKQLWGDDLCRRLVVAFTFGDAREDQSRDMQEELEEVWPELKKVMKDARGRYVVFNNEAGNTDATPVAELVQKFPKLQNLQVTEANEFPRSIKMIIRVAACFIVAGTLYLLYWGITKEP